MSEGKSIRIHAPATGKARRPTVESLTAGRNRLLAVDRFLPRDASAERGDATVSCPSVRPSVRL